MASGNGTACSTATTVMEELIRNNPDAVEYAKLVHQFLWGACQPTYLTIMGSWATVKVVRAVLKDI